MQKIISVPMRERWYKLVQLVSRFAKLLAVISVENEAGKMDNAVPKFKAKIDFF